MVNAENISIQQGPEHVEPADIRQIDLDKIIISELCCRSSEGDDPIGLMESISRAGLIHCPNVVDNGDGTFLLLCGRRRYHACKALGWQRMPCAVRQKNQKDLIFIALAENLQRLDSNPVDEAIFLSRAKKQFDYSDEELGERTGLKQSGVSERLSILKLPDDILKEVGNGESCRLKFTHAVALAYLTRYDRSQKNSEIRDLAAKAIQYKLTTVELKMLVKLIIDGGYDRLPDKLRMLLFSHQYMTADVANIYLNVENICDEGEMQKYRDVIPKLDKARIANDICKAVAAEMPFDGIKRQIIGFIKREKKAKEGGADDGISAQTVKQHFSKLVDEVRISREKIIELSKNNPRQMEDLKRIALDLIKNLRNLLADMEPDTNTTRNEIIVRSEK